MQLRLNFVGKFQRLFKRERVCEGEVRRLVLRVREHVRELQCKLLITVEEVRNFGDNAPPLLLLGRHHPIDGLQALVVEFGLAKTEKSVKTELFCSAILMRACL